MKVVDYIIDLGFGVVVDGGMIVCEGMLEEVVVNFVLLIGWYFCEVLECVCDVGWVKLLWMLDLFFGVWFWGLVWIIFEMCVDLWLWSFWFCVCKYFCVFRCRKVMYCGLWFFWD